MAGMNLTPELAARGLTPESLTGPARVAVAAVAPVLDAALSQVAQDPSALRVLAELLQEYGRAAEQHAAALVAERRRTIAEHRAAMARGGVTLPVTRYVERYSRRDTDGVDHD
jgi:hypothetical protein